VGACTENNQTQKMTVYLLYHQEHEVEHNNVFHWPKSLHPWQFDHCIQCSNHRLPKHHATATAKWTSW